MREELIAPCGMNCAVCSGYLALTHDAKAKGIKMPYCPGCRPRGKRCAFLKKRCGLILKGKVKYCFECKDFPCDNLRKIDGRYRAHYHMSMIKNLELVRDKGVAKLLAAERKKWKCPKCGGVICCHNGLCFDCELDRLKDVNGPFKKRKYRWVDD